MAEVASTALSVVARKRLDAAPENIALPHRDV
jgi:hypothetical protein